MYSEVAEAEQRVVGLLMCEGLSDAEIAGQLFVSMRTVQSQLAAAYPKAEAYFGLAQVSARWRRCWGRWQGSCEGAFRIFTDDGRSRERTLF